MSRCAAFCMSYSGGLCATSTLHRVNLDAVAFSFRARKRDVHSFDKVATASRNNAICAYPFGSKYRIDIDANESATTCK